MASILRKKTRPQRYLTCLDASAVLYSPVQRLTPFQPAAALSFSKSSIFVSSSFGFSLLLKKSVVAPWPGMGWSNHIFMKRRVTWLRRWSRGSEERHMTSRDICRKPKRDGLRRWMRQPHSNPWPLGQLMHYITTSSANGIKWAKWAKWAVSATAKLNSYAFYGLWSCTMFHS
jgi:hypothetical protein